MRGFRVPAFPPIIQGPVPSGSLRRKRAYALRPEQIHPFVRIAHFQAGGLTIPGRIIFDYELVLILKGKGKWTCEDESRPYGPNDLLFIPPFVPHAFSAEAGSSEHVAVHFDFAPDCPPPVSGLDRRRPYHVQFTHALQIARQQRLFAGHRVEHALRDIVEEHNSSETLGAARASVHLAGVLLSLLSASQAPRSSSGQARDHARVESIVSHMRGHLGESLDHREFERVSGLSTSRLQAVFREVTGYPPLDYLRRLRVEEARRLLADPRLSVKEIAARIGFRDTSHFSKVFRRIDGLSPAHYRDALLAGRQEKA